MQIYPETKDPNEIKDFEYDWSDQLETGESVGAPTVAFIDTGGTTNPTNTFLSPITRVWLAGGTHGLRTTFTVRVTTSGGSGARTLEAAFGVDIVDTIIGATAPTDLANLQADLVVVRAAIQTMASGKRVTNVWRDGRRVIYGTMSLADLMVREKDLERKIADATIVAAGNVDGYTSARRPIMAVY